MGPVKSSVTRGRPRSAQASLDLVWDFIWTVGVLEIDEVHPWFLDYCKEIEIAKAKPQPIESRLTINVLRDFERKVETIANAAQIASTMLKELSEGEGLDQEIFLLGWNMGVGGAGRGATASERRQSIKNFSRVGADLEFLSKVSEAGLNRASMLRLKSRLLKPNFALDMLVAHAAVAWACQEGVWPGVSKSHFGPFARYIDEIAQDVDPRFRPSYTFHSLPSAIARTLAAAPHGIKLGAVHAAKYRATMLHLCLRDIAKEVDF